MAEIQARKIKSVPANVKIAKRGREADPAIVAFVADLEAGNVVELTGATAKELNAYAGRIRNVAGSADMKVKTMTAELPDGKPVVYVEKVEKTTVRTAS